jgi:hypothetical protein
MKKYIAVNDWTGKVITLPNGEALVFDETIDDKYLDREIKICGDDMEFDDIQISIREGNRYANDYTFIPLLEQPSLEKSKEIICEILASSEEDCSNETKNLIVKSLIRMKKAIAMKKSEAMNPRVLRYYNCKKCETGKAVAVEPSCNDVRKCKYCHTSMTYYGSEDNNTAWAMRY